jgi:hypothetical protein
MSFSTGPQLLSLSNEQADHAPPRQPLMDTVTAASESNGVFQKSSPSTFYIISGVWPIPLHRTAACFPAQRTG